MNKEMKKRNLLSTIRECFDEHRVTLNGENGPTDRYLIEVKAPSTEFSDFLATYSNELTDFKVNLAEKLLNGAELTGHARQNLETYGVLVDQDLKHVFAFNRKFADLNRDKQTIEFKTSEDVLLDASSNTDLSEEQFPESDYPVGGGMVAKYALQGKKGNSPNPQGGKVNFEQKSLLDVVRTFYSTKTVELYNEDGSSKGFYLIETPYATSTHLDFKRTYARDLSAFQKKLAKRVFGEDKTENNYALLIDTNMKIKFAFNTAFARYDERSNTVVYKSAEDVLLEASGETDLSNPVQPNPRPPRRPRPGGGMVAKYALQGKKPE